MDNWNYDWYPGASGSSWALVDGNMFFDPLGVPKKIPSLQEKRIVVSECGACGCRNSVTDPFCGQCGAPAKWGKVIEYA